MPTPLAALAPFAPTAPAQLARLGFTSVEQAIGAAQLATSQLQAFLGGVNLATLALPFLEIIPENIRTIIQNAIYALGVPMAPMTATYTPGAGLPAAPLTPAVKSLVPDMPPVRAQGNRPTCVAYSSLAALEHNLKKHPAPFVFLFQLDDCSEQWLYFKCKKKDGNINPGTLVSNAYDSLANDGSVPEFDWPYQSPGNPNDPGTPLPPLGESELSVIGGKIRIKEGRALNAKSVSDYKAAIDNGRAVTFWVPVFKSWFENQWSSFLGEITMPVPGEQNPKGDAHAMCIVGYMDQPEFPEIGGGRFLVRNSWDAKWGLLSLWGDRVNLPSGYGTIPYAYITNFGQEAFIVARGPFE